jgi:uncharacterized membrane protein
MLKKFLAAGFFLAFLIFPLASSAQDSGAITDWYLKDFHSDIVVNSDSSTLVTEKITADCGNLPDKHGIFRTLPTQINSVNGKILTPVELVSITDFYGNPYMYQTSRGNGTITWKIGDPNHTVTGVNEYQIVYKVKNAVRLENGAAELYWNLNGNFWQLVTDNYSADISFPAGINPDNTKVEVYSGATGAKDDTLSSWQWQGDILTFQSKRIMQPGEGITVSAAMPSSIFTPYQLTLSDRFPGWQWILLPLIVFMIYFAIWKKFGEDPKLHKTIIAQYEPPAGFGPLEISLGAVSNKFITAAIIQLAVDGILKISETDSKILMFEKKDYRLEKTNNIEAIAKLLPAERAIYEGIFGGESTRLLSELKNKFYKIMPDVQKKTQDWAVQNGYMDKTGFKLQAVMVFVSILAIIIAIIFSKNYLSAAGISSLLIAGVIAAFFSALMSRRTPKGAEAAWQIKGFKLFIKTADQYRAQFYEKENMFEKVLPYAIAFGLTKKWIENARAIYGDDKFLALAPVWYVGAGGFNADTFTSSMESVASAIAANVSSPSGQGGAGGAGGGGGGGGGGGW